MFKPRIPPPAAAAVLPATPGLATRKAERTGVAAAARAARRRQPPRRAGFAAVTPGARGAIRRCSTWRRRRCSARRPAASAPRARRLAVIDYSRPSLVPRLWVFDLAAGKLLYEEVVAHGQGSGENLPTRFSNSDGSHQSSLGLFVTADTYTGKNGYSLRMHGLEPGVNDAAMARAIVMHGAPYVDPVQGKRMGRLGRSWGCPRCAAPWPSR